MMSEKFGNHYSVADLPARDTLETWVGAFVDAVESYKDEYDVYPTAFMYAPNAPQGFADAVHAEYEWLKMEKISLQPYVFRLSNGAGDTFDMKWFANRGSYAEEELDEELLDEDFIDETDDEDVVVHPESEDSVTIDELEDTVFTYDEEANVLYIHVYEDLNTKVKAGYYRLEAGLDQDDVQKLFDIQNDEEAGAYINELFRDYSVIELEL